MYFKLLFPVTLKPTLYFLSHSTLRTSTNLICATFIIQCYLISVLPVYLRTVFPLNYFSGPQTDLLTSSIALSLTLHTMQYHVMALFKTCQNHYLRGKKKYLTFSFRKLTRSYKISGDLPPTAPTPIPWHLTPSPICCLFQININLPFTSSVVLIILTSKHWNLF